MWRSFVVPIVNAIPNCNRKIGIVKVVYKWINSLIFIAKSFLISLKTKIECVKLMQYFSAYIVGPIRKFTTEAQSKSEIDMERAQSAAHLYHSLSPAAGNEVAPPFFLGHFQLIPHTVNLY